MKTNIYYVIAFILISNSNLLYAENPKTSADLIASKIHKETKAERKRNDDIAMRLAMTLSHARGERLIDVINPDIVTRIDIPYRSGITRKQVAYLFHHAVFKKTEDIPGFSLVPAGDFSMLLVNTGFLLKFHTYYGAPMVKLEIESQVFWLEIPNPKDFYSLGNEKELDSPDGQAKK